MRFPLVLAILTLAACTSAPAQPVSIDTVHDACDHCRMVVSDVHVAAEIVAPGEEPRIFDDIGCLRDYLAEHEIAEGATVFVAEHLTGAWIEAAHAIFTRTRDLRTPMGSGIVAHASIASRNADTAARDGDDVQRSAVIALRPASTVTE